MRRMLLLAAIVLAGSSVALADPVMAPEPLSYQQLPDARQEASAQALMETIRCVVCQGQSIADSSAPLAGDMRAIVREKIAAGEKPEAIRAWMIARYGQWVSYKPTLSLLSGPLWLAPLLLLLVGGWVASRTLRRRRAR